MMRIQREWVTPIAAGAFLLSAVTGVLLFFHMDSGLNKVAHEWLSWVLLGGVALHVVVNFSGLKRHLGTLRGKILIGVFALILGLSFVGPGEKSEPPFMRPVQALSAAPLTTLAAVARLSPAELQARLSKAGLHPMNDQQSLSDLTGPDMRKQMEVLGVLFAETK